MGRIIDEELHRRTQALLEPGEIDLNGTIVHTPYDGQEDVKMMQATIDVGDVIAEAADFDPADCYVYSGNDDTDFASNQHQGRTLDGDDFVWECQQLLRQGSFDLVFYYEASADQDAILDGVEELGFEATGVEG
ncbi:DUF5778 family protein [Halovivax limisalsi]|uniref:DUF5778 family protein n=1 Tax=Halovivax limisalsi TaxID=1453760 RepID=UPI001FFD4C04|nr:DUF5778 family protein [Halovivax limisalsi]